MEYWLWISKAHWNLWSSMMRILTLKADPKFCSRYIKERELYVSGCIYWEQICCKFATYFKKSFCKNSFEGLLLFVCLIFAFVVLHSFYVSCELLYFYNWSVKATTWRPSTNKLYCNWTQKLLEGVQVLVALYVVSLQIY